MAAGSDQSGSENPQTGIASTSAGGSNKAGTGAARFENRCSRRTARQQRQAKPTAPLPDGKVGLLRGVRDICNNPRRGGAS